VLCHIFHTISIIFYYFQIFFLLFLHPYLNPIISTQHYGSTIFRHLILSLKYRIPLWQCFISVIFFFSLAHTNYTMQNSYLLPSTCNCFTTFLFTVIFSPGCPFPFTWLKSSSLLSFIFHFGIPIGFQYSPGIWYMK